MASDYGTTIQLWPGGRSLEYQGDPDGPADQRRLKDPNPRAPHCPNDCRPSRIVSPAAMAAQGWTPDTLPARVIIDPTVIRDPDLEASGDYYTACNCNGGYLATPPPNDWRPGTPAEWRAIRIELRALNYQRNLIWHCDSSLVDDLIKASQERGALEGFDYDAIANLYTTIDEDTDAAALREYASDYGVDLPNDIRQTACAICGLDIEGTLCDPAGEVRRWLDRGGNWTGSAPVGERDPDAPEAETHYHAPVPSDLDSDEEEWLTEAREVCREYAQDNPAEIYEWWRVDPWLAARLQEIGQCVIDNNYGEWWGRCTTGQSLIMDGVLQRIAAGQEPDPAEGEAGR